MISDKEAKQLVEDIGLIKRAVIGEESTGHVGLVKDVAAIKEWRNKLDLRVATVTGAVTVVFLIVKHFIDKIKIN